MVRGNRSGMAGIGQAAVLALGVAWPGLSVAQSVAPAVAPSVVEPAVTFPVTSAAELITPLAPPSADLVPSPAPGSLPLGSLWADPRAVARLFREACIQTEGQAAA